MVEEVKLGIYEVVNALKEEIRRLEEDGKEKHLFKIDKAIVQLSVAVDKQADGGINVWVFHVEGLFKKENTHTITLELTPLSGTIVAAIK
jgi:hypothetical protein